MKVRATRLGFYGDKRRRPGEIFELRDRERRGKPYPAEEQFSKSWMERMDGPTPVQSTPEAPKAASSSKRKSSVI